MSALAIKVAGMSKQYRVGEIQDRYPTLRDSLARSLRALVTRDRTGIWTRERMWALRDVSFEVKPGGVVGIVGRNGAGKTTLLRILSRITEPTSGFAEVRGRVGSLLEVGTGFHPELTGRDNIFLNGAILGMRRAEIARKFDEIVEFSGVEKHIDTQVKRYSSGMYVRLAFSVAAHLEPEILLVDEVLAVGDAEFQRKCLGKMQSIGEAGRTVLFISHQMPTITRLCQRAILLDGGAVIDDGDVERVVTRYLTSEHGSSAHRVWADPETAPGSDFVRLRSLRVVDEKRETAESIDVRQAVGLELVIDVLKRGAPFVPWIALFNGQGQHVFSVMDTDPSWHEARDPGRYRSIAWIPPNLLNEGTLIATVSLNTFVAAPRAVRQAHVEDAIAFQVYDQGEGDTARGNYVAPWSAPVRPLLSWSCDYEPLGARELAEL
jgi:lipopolysaccharide transport system ATP-binding protein